MGFGSKVRMSFSSTGIQNSYRFWSLITTCTCACVERLNMFQQAARSGLVLQGQSTCAQYKMVGVCEWVWVGFTASKKLSSAHAPRPGPRMWNSMHSILYSTLLHHACIHAPTGHTFNFVQATFDRSFCKTQPVLAILLNVN